MSLIAFKPLKSRNGATPFWSYTILYIKYFLTTPLPISKREIKNMSDDELLDMDYFLHEGDDDDEDFFGAEGFYIF